MRPLRKISRRSFVAIVTGATMAGAGLVGAGAAAQPRTGITNRDPTDPPGNGRLPITDRDPEDRTVSGRPPRRTDRDPTDPVGRGRCGRRAERERPERRPEGGTYVTGYTDADAGPSADPICHGWGPAGRPR